jgi:hypothetical protein
MKNKSENKSEGKSISSILSIFHDKFNGKLDSIANRPVGEKILKKYEDKVQKKTSSVEFVRRG